MKSVWACFLVVVVCLGVTFVLFHGIERLPVNDTTRSVTVLSKTTSSPVPMSGVHVGGSFSLTDLTGKTVTEKSWPGKFKLVYFGFTHCPELCPMALLKISTVVENNDPLGAMIVPLFITVDPQRDTRAVMAAYIKNFNANIVGLTGTPAQIKAAEDVYKVYAAKVPSPPALHPMGAMKGMNNADDYLMDHSGFIYWMSPDNKLLAIFSSNETPEAMINKIAMINRIKDAIK